MSSLTGNLISDSYQGLFKTVDNGPISSTLTNVTDGNGNATVLSLSTVSASISGDVTIDGYLHATSSYAITSSYIATASIAVSASNANYLDGLDSTAFVLLSGSNVMTGSIDLNGSLSFTEGTFVLPSSTAPIPVVGSAYFSGSALYIYDGNNYLSVTLN